MRYRDPDYVCLRIAGEGGEGIISAGELLTQSAGRLGMHIQTYKTFPAEIRGGMAVYQIRVGPDRILSQGDYLDVLVASEPLDLSVSGQLGSSNQVPDSVPYHYFELIADAEVTFQVTRNTSRDMDLRIFRDDGVVDSSDYVGFVRSAGSLELDAGRLLL